MTISIAVYPLNCYAIYYLLKIIEKDRRTLTNECCNENNYKAITVTLKIGQDQDIYNSIRRKTTLQKSDNSSNISRNTITSKSNTFKTPKKNAINLSLLDRTQDMSRLD